ncbi:hypothetical protein Tco_0985748 [Tanacetum coccineum]
MKYVILISALGDTVRMLMVLSLFPEGTIVAGVILVRGHIVPTMLKVLPVGIDLCPSAELIVRPIDDRMGRGKRTKKTLGLVEAEYAGLVKAEYASLVWICQISQEISQKWTRERMSDQEAKEIKAEAREIMPQPSTVNCS